MDAFFIRDGLDRSARSDINPIFYIYACVIFASQLSPQASSRGDNGRVTREDTRNVSTASTPCSFLARAKQSLCGKSTSSGGRGI